MTEHFTPASEVSRPRILYYCQSLLGIGHLIASQRVVEALLPRADVDLIQGGLDNRLVVDHAGHRCLRLPTLLHDLEDGGFVDPDQDRDAGEVWPERAAAIGGFLRHPYDAVVVEFWPFGRRRFKSEIRSLLAAVQSHAGRDDVPVFSSVREVLVPRAHEKEQRMLEGVRKHIHTVFVRGDPTIIPFDDTFRLARELGDKLCYTGYISPPPLESPPVRKPQVLVSQGGGDVGRALLVAAIEAAPALPGLQFRLAAGSRSTADELAALRSCVRSTNVEVVPFLAEFTRRLAESALSIGMGGDNTIIDLVTTRTPALAYPYPANPEQGIRIERFAAHGFVHALAPEDLAPSRLVRRIESALAAPYPTRAVATNGQQVTADRILEVLHARASR